MIIDKVFIQIRASVTYMEYGQAKWIIHPLRIKVRLMRPKDWKEVTDRPNCNYAIDDTDYAGVEHLKLMLDDLQYYDDGKDLAPYQLEPLDPDWKSKHLDHCRDSFGHPSGYDEWFCEIHSWGSADDRDKFCKKKEEEYIIAHNPNAELVNYGSSRIWKNADNRPHNNLLKEWVNEFCRSKGLGRAIPIFLVQYKEDVEWIEKHLLQILEVKKTDGRGKNPNSLKNLKQFKK